MREISEHIMDIAQNSIKAEASFIEISLIAETKQDVLKIAVKDNGKGMSEEFLSKVCDPFKTSRTTRKVGLGIPLFKDTAEKCDGTLTIESKLGFGTTLNVNMNISHIDRPPLGELADTLHILIISNPNLDFFIKIKYDLEENIFDTREIKETLYPVTLDNSDVSMWVRENLKESITNVFGGKL